MSIELSRIGDIIYYFFIDDNYKIDYELEWTDVIQDYIMRYRRIIGILILVILLGIMRNCNFNNKSELKIEASNNKQIWNGKGGAVLAAVPVASALGSGGAAALASGAGASVAGAGGAAALASGAGASAAGSGGAAALASSAGASVAGSGGAAALANTMGKSVGSNVAQNAAKNAMSNATLGNSRSNSRKLMNAATGGKYNAMREAGLSKFYSGVELTRQGGQFVADKFKEFANWLYEILFAIAISIAICMIVVPSIAFFALGLICYFLLRKKISSMKAF